MRQRKPLRCRRDRRGSIYVLTLATAMLVTVFALASILLVRVQRRQLDAATETLQAELLASRAVDMALFRIEHEAIWRSQLAGGAWESDQNAAAGTYSFAAADPTDADLTDSDADPVVVVGIGKCGQSRQKVQVRLEVEEVPLGCLEVALHTGGNVTFSSATVACDQIICADGVMTASLSTINSDVEAVGTITGTGYTGTITTGVDARSMPDPDTVLEYYLANGTVISMASIPTVEGVRTISAVLLSPTSNPYGAQINPQGIYVIDCLGSRLDIRDCRVVGTIVLLNLAVSSQVYGSLNWQPAVAGYPSLMVKGTLSIATDAAMLDEATLGVDFNGDSDMADAYPSVFKGLVCTSAALNTSNACTFEGILCVGLGLNCTGSLFLEYDTEIFENPPPGFTEIIGMKVAPGTWQRAVD
ncbi:MAG: hypothetical protein JXB62_23460 [Pirellulales bacterium]|nr:hypothetical protein [Pirellulales bacterium]